MRIALWFLGLELLAIETSHDEQAEHNPDADLSGGTTYSTPVGFTTIDPRWETGTDYQ